MYFFACINSNYIEALVLLEEFNLEQLQMQQVEERWMLKWKTDKEENAIHFEERMVECQLDLINYKM